ncbi:MAG: asparaginase [Synergistaceae bacterium]|jgi:L-asparaginase|nr:asparaginase [Synergistaceae bacterium]
MINFLFVLLVFFFFYPSIVSATEINKTPRVYVLATGGTISAAAENNAETSDYTVAQRSIRELLRSLPDLGPLCEIDSEQFSELDSSDITTKEMLALSKYINSLLMKDTIDALVLTYGTDTMEEAAYFLNLTVRSNKPIVLVGAMRPDSAISADGPLNLYNAILVACNKEAVGKGVLICINDGIYCARDVRKTSTYKANAFQGSEYGCIGSVQSGTVRFYYESIKKHTWKSSFNIYDLEDLPNVEIIYGYLGSSISLISHAIKSCQGIVFAGNGNGSLNKNTISYLKSAKSLPVLVRSSKTMCGAVQQMKKYKEIDILTADDLTPQKARILLMLSLTKTNSLEEIQGFFNQY